MGVRLVRVQRESALGLRPGIQRARRCLSAGASQVQGQNPRELRETTPRRAHWGCSQENSERQEEGWRRGETGQALTSLDPCIQLPQTSLGASKACHLLGRLDLGFVLLNPKDSD